MEQNWYEYSITHTQDKRGFVMSNIFDRIKASGRVLKVFRGSHPDRGQLVDPGEEESMELITQKLRDMKKRMLLKHRKNKSAAKKKSVIKKTTAVKKKKAKAKPAPKKVMPQLADGALPSPTNLFKRTRSFSL
jgi:argininosuccinate lyase